MLNSLQIKDIRSLQVFRTVVEAQGISAAQEALGMTQSNISSLILDLEQRLGVVLCERGRAGFRVSSEGEQVYQTTCRMLADLDIYQDQLQSIGTGLQGKLAIGHMEHYLGHPENTLVEALGHLTREAPAIELDLRTAPLADLEESLLRGDLQVIIGTFTRELEGFDYRTLHSEEQGLYCSAEHPLALAGAEPRQEDIRNTAYAAGLFGYGEESSLLSKRVADVHQIESMLVFLLSGSGIGFLPVHVAEPYVASDQLRQLTLRGVSGELDVRVAVRQQSLSSPLVSRFLDLLIPG